MGSKRTLDRSSAAGWADRAWGAVAAVRPRVMSTAALAQALVDTERLISRLHANQMQLLADLARPGRWDDVVDLVEGMTSRSGADPGGGLDLSDDGDVAAMELLVTAQAQRMAATEAAGALGVSSLAAANRVATAVELTCTLPGTWSALHEGQIDRSTTAMLLERTGVLGVGARREVEERILPLAGRRSLRRLRVLTDRAIIVVDPEAAARRERKARSDRDVNHRPLPDGMGMITATLPADGALSVQTLLEVMAGADPDRTRPVGARRADALVGIADALLTRGQLDLRPLFTFPAGSSLLDSPALVDSIWHSAHPSPDLQVPRGPGLTRQPVDGPPPDNQTATDQTGQTATDQTPADPTATDPTATNLTATDPAGTDPADTDRTAADSSATGQTATDPAAAAAPIDPPGRQEPQVSTPVSPTPAIPAFNSPVVVDPLTPDPLTPDPLSSEPLPSEPLSSSPAQPPVDTQPPIYTQPPVAPQSPTFSPPTRQGRPVDLVVTLSLATLAGIDQLPGNLTGHGAITAELARTLTAAARSVTLLAVNPETGAAVGIGERTYRPRQKLKDQVLILDERCSWPGCSQKSWRCDLDHRREFNHRDPTHGGPTQRANLDPQCRWHHLLKTHTGWTVHRSTNRSVTITSPAGPSYEHDAVEFTLPGEWLDRRRPDEKVAARANATTPPDQSDAISDHSSAVALHDDEPPF